MTPIYSHVASCFVYAWFEGAPKVSPKTAQRYRELADRQVIPHLGALKLQKLRPEHVEQWHGTLLRARLAPRTVGHAHRLLARVLGCGKVEEREIEILTADQIAEVRTKLAGHTLAPIVELALATGLRRGELLGLQWGDVDLDAGTLRVERSVEETRGGLRLKPPKTKRGRRTITLGEGAVAMLRAHKVQQMELRFAIGAGAIKPATLVFSTIEGELLSPDNLSRDWCRVRTARKLPLVPFHALRHTHASVLIRAGVDILTISRRLGHSKAAITLDVYGHLMQGADAAAAKAIEGVLK